MTFFDKCIALAHKLRHFLILGGLLCLLAVISLWVYLDNIRAATAYTNYEWVSDTTQMITEPIAPDGEFRQSFTTSDPIFGGGFVFTIYEKICYGTVTLALEDETGNVLTSTSMPGIDLYDNTFQQMVFPTAIYPDGQTTYDFVIHFAPEKEESNLGVWVSEAPSETIAPYLLNGTQAETCASFAIVTKHAGNFIIPIYFALSAFAALALIIGYWLLFIRKAKLPILFAYFAITLGVLYMALIPPYVAPDEEMHIHTAYALSNNILGVDNDNHYSVRLRAADDIAFDKADQLDIFTYQTATEQLFGKCPNSTIVSTEHKIVYTEPFYIYLPTAIGITAARLLNFNYVTLIFFGRVMNLLAYTALGAFAIYLMPAFKRILCIVGLLPMSLQLAASFNYDAIVLATALLYTALVLKTVAQQEDFSWKQLFKVALLSLLLAPMKKLYVFLCLFLCILPLKKCPKLIQKWFWRVIALGVVVGICLIPKILEIMWITPEYLAMAAILEVPKVNPLNIDYNENYLWLWSYILTHLGGALKVVLRTFEENIGLYLVQLIGGKAGEYILLDLPIWTPLIGVFYGALFLSAVPTAEEKPMLSLAQKCWCGLLLLATVAGLFTICLSWTPIRNTTIWGIQGRYFLPVLPLALLVLQPKKLTLSENIERPLLLTVVFSNMIAVANVFQQIMAFSHR